MELVQDISRPDVNGVPPKMQAIADAVAKALENKIPHLSVTTNDNIMSSVIIRGNLTPKHQWVNGIYENGKYFTLRIIPDNNKRYYDPTDAKVTIEAVVTKGNKFRKYTGAISNVIEKLQTWLSCTIEN